MKVIVIGKDSNLSTSLKKEIPDILLISARNINDYFFSTLENNQESISIIFNNFYPSTKLNESSNLDEYIHQSISTTSNVLSLLSKYNLNIKKIIYSSSSSVYGNNSLCSEGDDPNPGSLQACLKLSNEKLIERFCNKNEINYTITRIFNMFGGRDQFSVISKIENSYKEGTILNINNHGSGIRDFIYIEDVVNIYRVLLFNQETSSNIINIGTGVGISVAQIISKLKEESIDIKVSNLESMEIKQSIANTNNLKDIFNTKEFVNVVHYLIQKLK